MLFIIAATIGIYALDQIITNCKLQENCLTIYGILVSKFHVFFTNILLIISAVLIVLMYAFAGYLYYINARIHKAMFLNHKKPSDYCVLLSGVNHEKVNGQSILNKFSDYQIVDILYTHKI